MYFILLYSVFFMYSNYFLSRLSLGLCSINQLVLNVNSQSVLEHHPYIKNSNSSFYGKVQNCSWLFDNLHSLDLFTK